MAATDFGGTPIWAASWDRSRLNRNDDWFSVAAITETHLIIAQPKETDQSSRSLQAKTHRLLNRASAADEPLRGMSVAEQLIRSCGNCLIIQRSEVLSINALASGNLLRVRTRSGIHMVGSFRNKRDVTWVATNLAAVVLPDAAPRAVARPRLTGDLLRQLAVAPAAVAGFFVLALVVRVAIDDRSSAVTASGRNRGIEQALQTIPIPVLAAVGLLVVAALVMRIMFRARDEVQWLGTGPATQQMTPSPGAITPQAQTPALTTGTGPVTEF